MLHWDIPLVLLTWFAFTSEVGAVERCLHYSQPKNGRIVCDSLFKLFCAPECTPGFVFAFRPAVVYMCGPVTGEWYTYPPGHTLPWPDCVNETGNSKSNAMDEINARRMEISKRITSSRQAMFPQYTAGQQNTRYQHLYKFVQRARQAYKTKSNAIESVTGQRERTIQDRDMEHRQTQAYLENASNKLPVNTSNASQRDKHVNQDTSYPPMRNSYLENASNKLHVNSSDASQHDKQVNQDTSDSSMTKADSSTENQHYRLQSDKINRWPRITNITDEVLNFPRSPRREKLFYFPITRDTLIKMLPKHLHEKYVDLRQNTTKQPERLQGNW